MRQLSVLYTGNQQGYSIRYSPFDSNLLACVACDKFGLSGSSSLIMLKYTENAFMSSQFEIVESFKNNSTMFDVDWAPIDPSLLVTGNGDGSVSVWKYPMENKNMERKPVFNQRQHHKEVYSVNWEPSGMRMYHFLSASWDQTIKVWNLSNSGLTFLSCLSGHDSIVYSAAWNPKKSGVIVSTSADKTFRLWDVNSSDNSTPIFTSKVNKSDILCCDWSKFDSNLFVLGYASGLIELRDFRNLKNPPLSSFEMAHDYAVRKVRFSPHFPKLFASISYDMTTKLWTPEGLVDANQNHTEFAYGLDFDSKVNNRLVDCGWDRRVMISEFEGSNKF